VTRLFNPDRHRPVETCARCRQAWPCAGEQARVDTQRVIAERVRIATDAASAMKASGLWPTAKSSSTEEKGQR
jgi:hypothetical protein